MLNVSLIGNLGGDPEQRYTQAGQATLRFNVACNGRVKDQSGNWVDETTWVRVTVFGNRAETLGQYLKKGTRVFVSGRLEARPWTSNQGEVRAGLEVIADTVEFMSAKNEAAPELVRAGKPTAAAIEDLDDFTDEVEAAQAACEARSRLLPYSVEAS